jgi:predicted SAM-dependent methyltransferase
MDRRHTNISTAKSASAVISEAATLTAAPSLLNLGCGNDTHPAFVNVDIVGGPGIVAHDLRLGIPFPDATYDLVYHSTMLSHLRPQDALSLMRECRRVLKPGGVLRVVTEDLEQMCQTYLQKLDAACGGDDQAAREYEWMVLELYDQATREHSGGGMSQYLSQDTRASESFIYSRVGEQGKRMMAAAQARKNQKKPLRTLHGSLLGLRARARQAVYTALLGPRGLQALELGQFRLSSGQVSYRMYDRYSLAQLFLGAGLASVSLANANESICPSWKGVNLDLSPDGTAARPHALIMEGVRS